MLKHCNKKGEEESLYSNKNVFNSVWYPGLDPEMVKGHQQKN